MAESDVIDEVPRDEPAAWSDRTQACKCRRAAPKEEATRTGVARAKLKRVLADGGEWKGMVSGSPTRSGCWPAWPL